MILQALNDYYQRLSADPSIEVPEPGFAPQKISFCLVLDRQGNLVQVRDLRKVEGKRKIPRMLVVPEGVKRTVGIAANFLWDKAEYVLGAIQEDEKQTEEERKKKRKRALECWDAFKTLHHDLCDNLEDDGMAALLAFLDAWNPDKAKELADWEEMAGSNLVFQLDGELNYLHERKIARECWLLHKQQVNGATATCLVTGVQSSVARLHPAIKGVRGAQTSGAALISFNLDAFTSYGKKQNFNAPVSEKAAFAYTTALNHLLAQNSRQKVRIGDTTTVFWTEKPSRVEDLLADLFEGKWEKEEDQAEDPGLKADLRLFMEAVRDGKQVPNIDPSVPFYILGLAPNASRLAVRFWQVSTVGQIQKRIGQHFQDLAIEKSFASDPEFPGIWQLLIETAVQHKTDNINPALAGSFMRAILTGNSYPQSLLAAVIGRLRADQTINYLRAAMIKACLVRKFRIYNQQQMEVTMTLNKESTNPAYCLGRLFAILEKAQRDALGQNINATIRDRYYGAASTTPASVFPILLRLGQHYIQKAEYGYVNDRMIEEVMCNIERFPAHLSLDEQGLFALGYYHQRQDFYKKNIQDSNN